jgi:2-polyprenyl-6-methoxyphenol hydroxylase-like FAD-dependent oxidoreductase
MATAERTTCAVVGGGPAGMMLGLLLARAGVDVTVLEKHGDFLRDFRGDTVHTSTLTLIDELGLWPQFSTLPYKPLRQMQISLESGTVPFADPSRLRASHPFVAMVPQWHFLDMLADAGEAEETFALRMAAEVTDVTHEAGAVSGLRYRTSDGSEHDLSADLVVACDGRASTVREASRMRPRSFGVPMDVWWFRLPRSESDPEGVLGRFGRGRVMVLLDRGDYYQCAFLIRKGTDASMRGRPISSLHEMVRGTLPWLADRIDQVSSWDDVKLLEVTLDRLRRWRVPGLLCIGDAAHAMSPVGGVGINLAVQDAVAAGRLLAGPLLDSARAREGGAAPARAGIDAACARVQRRRWLPTAATQLLQRIAHRRVLRPVLDDPGQVRSPATPVPFRLLRRFPPLRVVPAFLVGIGLRPEHAPDFARRFAAESGAANTPSVPTAG